MNPALTDHARLYHADGRTPLHLPPRAKRPVDTAWQTTTHADVDLDALARAYGNLGVVLGAPSAGLVDADLDCPEAVRLAPALLPATPARWGRASRESHRGYVCRDAERTIQYRDPMLSGDTAMLVELRATGGQTVVPPSVYPDGESCVWHSTGTPTAIGWADLRSRVATLAAASLLARHWPALGSRHAASLALAGALARAGRPPAEVAELLGAIAEAASDEEWRDRATAARTTAARIARGERVTGLPTLAELIDRRVVDRVAEWLGLGRHHDDCRDGDRDHERDAGDDLGDDARAGRGLHFVSLRDLLARSDDAPPDALVDGLLYRQSFAGLVAKPKVGKSTEARALSLAVATGREFLGRETQQGTVWYLALEDKPNEIARHMRRMGATGAEPIRFIFGPAPEDAVAQIRDLAVVEKPALIIIDTIQRLARVRDLNDYAAVTLALEPILHIARLSGACVLMLHHAKKGETGWAGDNVLGSTAILGSVDTLISLRRTEHGRFLSTIQRYGDDLAEQAVELDDAGRPVLIGSRDEHDLGRGKEAVRAFLGEQKEPLTESEIREAVKGVRRVVIEKALRALVADNSVIRDGEGKRGAPYTYAFAVSPSLPPGTWREGERENRDSALTARDPDLVPPSRESIVGTEQRRSREGESGVASLAPDPIRAEREHYVAVLMADGMPAAEAERVAAEFVGASAWDAEL